MSEPICSKDCFNCPFPDCINDTFDAEDRAASEDVERDFVKPWTKEQLRKLEYQRQWREKNRERIRAYEREHQRAYYQKNRERILAYQREYKRAYYQKNRERILAAQKARRDARLDGPTENQRRREYHRAYNRAYYQKNRERILAARKALREAGKRKENEDAQSLSDRC